MEVIFEAGMISRADDYNMFYPKFRATMTKEQVLSLQSELQIVLNKYEMGELSDDEEEHF